MINWIAVGASIFPNVGGWIGGIITSANVKSKEGSIAWYDTLKRPDWRPPNWAFGPVWTGLYTGMGYASYLVYRDGGGFNGDARIPLILFGTQLALNWAWTPLFFGAHLLKWSLVDTLALAANVAVCGVAFYKVNPIAGYLFIPYMSWLCLASALNYAIWRDNPEGGPKIKELKD